MVDIVLHRAHDGIRVRAQNVREQQLVAVPIGVDRLVERDLRLLPRNLSDIHQDLVFDTARGVRRKLDVPVDAEGGYRLDKPDRPDGNEILHADSRVFKTPGQIHDQPQIALNERLFGTLASRRELF